jgi:protein O-GlcNAc transferase
MCRARNIYFDFSDLDAASSTDRYRENIFKPGKVGGRCKFKYNKFKKQGDHKSPLQSWYAELEHFKEFQDDRLNNGECDVTFKNPAIVIKLDAGINMYHHFCDFVNLYLTQHANNSFLQNVQISK